MLIKIKKRIEAALRQEARTFDRPPFSSLPISYRRTIRRYLQRTGKRIRPVLFVLGYLGFSPKPAANVYTAAAALELLHEFILIHDDIIDHDPARRGDLSLHAALNEALNKNAPRRFCGEDLAMVIGDILYAHAMQAVLSIREHVTRKQQALEQLTQAALYTGCGELEELLYTLTPLRRMTRAAILDIYDRKTAHYSFALPLLMGATLAGASKRVRARLFRYSMCLGRAFQINDDLIECSAGARGQKAIPCADIREGKRTLTLWFAYRHGSSKERRILERIYTRTTNTPGDLRQAGDIIIQSGAVRYAQDEIKRLARQADRGLDKIRMRTPFGALLRSFQASVLSGFNGPIPAPGT